ncbi:hypothetical protein Efla_002778 [Eimeria flavescens]
MGGPHEGPPEGEEYLSGSESEAGSTGGLPGASSPGAPSAKKGKRRGLSGGPFAALGLSASVAAAATKQLGFRLPTPVQRKAIPPLLQGRNVIALARTGSGKTAAFLLPLADSLQQHSSVVGIRGLVVAPSRELVLQTYTVAKKLLRGSSLIVSALVGGTDFARQFEALASNPDLLLATPGRLLQLLQDGVLRLSAVQFAVLDEADRMLELGWGSQLEMLWAALPPQRQGVFVSATLPEALVSFARLGLPDPVFVSLDKEGTLSENLHVRFVFVRPAEKIAALLALLKRLQERGLQALVFVSTRHQANLLHAIAAHERLLTAVIYGAMEQQDRNAQLLAFKKRRTLFLLVTDVAARGLDLPHLPVAINFDFPSSARLFIHRAGRTARAGSEGCAISLVTAADLPYALDLMTFVGGRIAPLTEWQRMQSATAAAAAAAGQAPEEGGCVGGSSVSASVLPKAAGRALAPLASQGLFPLGAPPPLDFFTESVERYCLTDSEVQTLQRSAAAAEKLYLKTRPSASRQACERARALLEECGGQQMLAATSFSEAALLPLLRQPQEEQQLTEAAQQQLQQLLAGSQKEGASIELLQTLRRFRPRVGMQGSVLTAAVVQGIEEKKRDAALLSVAVRRHAAAHLQAADVAVEGQSGSENGEGEGDAEGEEEEHEQEATAGSSSSRQQQPAVQQESSSLLSDLHAASSPSRHRVSKRRLLKVARELGLPASSPAAAAAAAAAAAGSSAGKHKTDSSFFVDVTAEAKAAGQHVMLQLQQQSMGLVADEEDDLRRSKTQEKRKWDPRKRKYVLMKVDSSTGLALKRQRGDEKREAKTSSAARYAQWAKATKKRIQNVGEMEDTQQGRQRPAAPPAAGRQKDAANKAEADSTSNKLRFLPLHAKHLGIKEALQSGAKLTHKQARIARKLIAKASPVTAQQRTGKKGSHTTAGDCKAADAEGKDEAEECWETPGAGGGSSDRSVESEVDEEAAVKDGFEGGTQQVDWNKTQQKARQEVGRVTPSFEIPLMQRSGGVQLVNLHHADIAAYGQLQMADCRLARITAEFSKI